MVLSVASTGPVQTHAASGPRWGRRHPVPPWCVPLCWWMPGGPSSSPVMLGRSARRRCRWARGDRPHHRRQGSIDERPGSGRPASGRLPSHAGGRRDPEGPGPRPRTVRRLLHHCPRTDRRRVRRPARSRRRESTTGAGRAGRPDRGIGDRRLPMGIPSGGRRRFGGTSNGERADSTAPNPNPASGSPWWQRSPGPTADRSGISGRSDGVGPASGWCVRAGWRAAG